MTKRMLVDATHPEEVRVAIIQDNLLSDLEIETAAKKQIKGNIYLGKVSRVEQSLQAAFIDFGHGRQGFLPLNDIHVKYFTDDEPSEEPKKAEPKKRRGRSKKTPKAQALPKAPEPQLTKDISELDDSATEAKPESITPEAAPTVETPVDKPIVENTTSDSTDEKPAVAPAVSETTAYQEDETTTATHKESYGEILAPKESPAIAPARDQAIAQAVIATHIPTIDDIDKPEEIAGDVVATTVSQTPVSDTAKPQATTPESTQPEPTEAEVAATEQKGEEAPLKEAESSKPKPAARKPRANKRAKDSEKKSSTEQARRQTRRRPPPIQQILTRGQTVLVQVVKEARGNKGASLTTNISLAGRYSVLLPENSGGGGISRKINGGEARKNLKEILSNLEIPEQVSLIIRTAGLNRTKREILRDMNYMLRVWKKIQEKVAKAEAPCLIHEEGDLITRTIRDLYTTDMEEILIEGHECYRRGKDFMRLLMPSYVKVVQPYKDSIPLFTQYKVESQIESMHNRIAQLKSGGYLVIESTEAMVTIDINSGRSTREKDIETTAFKTNMLAADEIARQLRLRDLGGLVVIDFIDMDDRKHNSELEKRVHEAFKHDRARIQIGKISQFGLLELSRQRMKPAFNEATRQECPRCKGLGSIRGIESSAIYLFRSIEEEISKGATDKLVYYAPQEVVNYIFNYKRKQLLNLEEGNNVTILINGDPELQTPEFRKEKPENNGNKDRGGNKDKGEKQEQKKSSDGGEKAEANKTPQSQQQQQGEQKTEASPEPTATPADSQETTDTPDGEEESPPPRRKRRRRRRRRRGSSANQGENSIQNQNSGDLQQGSAPTGDSVEQNQQTGEAAKQTTTATSGQSYGQITEQTPEIQATQTNEQVSSQTTTQTNTQTYSQPTTQKTEQPVSQTSEQSYNKPSEPSTDKAQALSPNQSSEQETKQSSPDSAQTTENQTPEQPKRRPARRTHRRNTRRNNKNYTKQKENQTPTLSSENSSETTPTTTATSPEGSDSKEAIPTKVPGLYVLPDTQPTTTPNKSEGENKQTKVEQTSTQEYQDQETTPPTTEKRPRRRRRRRRPTTTKPQTEQSSSSSSEAEKTQTTTPPEATENK
ncbi:MAG: Rne/Rng family ribonuclease [Magnetococcales bacterium]|nr:Rne/Rng family ribonuclease [Magnetococcales bacterium]